jgi:hypothetical protein
LEILLPKLHDAQATVRDGAARFNVVDCGRRWGKNVLLHDRGIDSLMADRLPVAWFAPTYKMLAEDWRELKGKMAEVAVGKLEQEHRLEVVGGGVLDMWSLDQPDAARGRRYRRVIINEAAQVPHLKDAWEMVIRPTLADYVGDAWLAGTPRGHNHFFELFQRGQDVAANPDWRSWRYPTSSNPYILSEEIEAARLDLPERVFRQEYLADFIEGEGAIFRNIQACLKAPKSIPKQHRGHPIVLGGDWGKQDDFTTLSLICVTCGYEVAHDRFNKIDYAFQRKRVESWVERWHVGYGLVERNSMGDPILEELQRSGLPLVGFDTTAISKPPLIESLALAFEREEIQWIDDPVWTAELEAYERKVSAVTGRSSYSAPEGGHDDTVMARALARKAALDGGGLIVFEV